MRETFVQIFISFPSKKDAEKFANFILEKRLAGCIQIFPIESRYRWKGKIERAKEWLTIIKTKKSIFSSIEKIAKKYNPYSVPEIILSKIEKGSAEYIKWLNSETI